MTWGRRFSRGAEGWRKGACSGRHRGPDLVSGCHRLADQDGQGLAVNSEDLECQTLPLLSKAAKTANFLYTPGVGNLLPPSDSSLRRKPPGPIRGENLGSGLV